MFFGFSSYGRSPSERRAPWFGGGVGATRGADSSSAFCSASSAWRSVFWRTQARRSANERYTETARTVVSGCAATLLSVRIAIVRSSPTLYRHGTSRHALSWARRLAFPRRCQMLASRTAANGGAVLRANHGDGFLMSIDTATRGMARIGFPESAPNPSDGWPITRRSL